MIRRDALRALAGSFAAAVASSSASCARPSAGGRSEASLWFAYGGKNREVLLSLVDRFHASQEKFAIKPVYQGDYFESLAKLRAAIAVGEAPSLTHVIVEVLPYLVEAGALEPIAIEPSIIDDLEPAIAQSGTFEGGASRPLYAIPFNRSTPIAYLNARLFDEARIDPPSTWDELRAAARALTKQRGSRTQWGLACPIDWWFWVALVGQAGGKMDLSLGGDAGEEALRLWQRMVHDDRSMKPPPGRDYNAWQRANEDFLGQNVAMIWTSTAFLRYLEGNASFPVRAAMLPKHVRRSVPTGGTMFVMPRRSRERGRDAALAFLRFMTEPAQANDWATRTGYIPISRRGVAQLDREGYYEKHPNDMVARAQLAHASPWPWDTALFRMQREAVQPRLEEAVLARRDAASALAEARRALVEL